MTMMGFPEHVGSTVAVVQVSFEFRAVVPSDMQEDADGIEADVRATLQAALEGRFGAGRWSYSFPEKWSHVTTRPQLSPEDEKARSRENMKALRDAFQQGRDEWLSELDDHPHNGTLGFWECDGIRDSVLVRASSGREAYEKAEADLGHCTDIEWIGTGLPQRQFIE